MPRSAAPATIAAASEEGDVFGFESCERCIEHFPARNDDDVEASHKQRAGHSIIIVGWDDELEVPVVDKDGKQVTRNGTDHPRGGL